MTQIQFLMIVSEKITEIDQELSFELFPNPTHWHTSTTRATAYVAIVDI